MDISFLLFLQDIRLSSPDVINSIFVALSAFVVGPGVIVIATVWYWCVNKKVGLMLMGDIVVTQVIVQAVKLFACVYRPWVLDSRVQVDAHAASEATGYSFPSAHTAMATSFFGTFLVCYRKKIWVVISMIALIVLVAFSRLWLGCHTPQDVLVGLLLAALTTCLVTWIAYELPKHKNLDIIVASILIVASVAVLIICCNKPYPLTYDDAGALLVNPLDMQVDLFKAVGISLGFAISWIIERRFVRFSVEGKTSERILRGIIGSVLVLGLFIFILPSVLGLFLDNNWAHFFKYFITLVVALLVYPLCIKAWQKFL